MIQKKNPDNDQVCGNQMNQETRNGFEYGLAFGKGIQGKQTDKQGEHNTGDPGRPLSSGLVGATVFCSIL